MTQIQFGQQCRRPRRGFSMLELLLALAMIAMLSATMYMGLHIAVRAREQAASVVGPMRTAVLAADLMRQDLESAVAPGSSTASALSLARPFVGVSANGADTLDFGTIGSDGSLDERPLSEGARRVEIGVRSNVTPPVLVRRVTRNLLASTEPEVEEEVLCRGVKSFTCRYFDGTIWQESWDSTAMGDVLPVAVEMTLEMNVPGARPGAEPRVYRVTRIVPLACAKPADATDDLGGF